MYSILFSKLDLARLEYILKEALRRAEMDREELSRFFRASGKLDQSSFKNDEIYFIRCKLKEIEELSKLEIGDE